MLGVGGGPCAGVNGIEEYSNSNLKLYPNPVANGNDIFIGETYQKISEIKMIDVTGKEIEYLKVNEGKISTSEIQPGFYILEINIDGIKSKNRILVQ